MGSFSLETPASLWRKRVSPQGFHHELILAVAKSVNGEIPWLVPVSCLRVLRIDSDQGDRQRQA
jgi:hypothetical protein